MRRGTLRAQSTPEATAAQIQQDATTHKMNWRRPTGPQARNPREKFLVALIGCGGNGCQILSKLVRLRGAVVALGLGDLQVNVYDPDRVSESNVGRQLFPRCDIGQLKAVVMAHRANMALETTMWKAFPERFAENSPDPSDWTTPHYDLVITCLDAAKPRKKIYDAFAGRTRSPAYWLDLGNLSDTGQVILGQFWTDSGTRLPTIVDLFPEVYDGTLPETSEPSCSVPEALERQRLSINDSVAATAFNVLDYMFLKGEIAYAGAWINIATGETVPQPILQIPVSPAKKRKADS